LKYEYLYSLFENLRYSNVIKKQVLLMKNRY
jgi:hypothetical protein